MAAIIPRAVMARVTSSRVKPPCRRASLIFRRRPQAAQGVGLGAHAVLPGDVHLEVAERHVRVEVEVLLLEPVLLAGVAHEDVQLVPLGAGALLRMVDELGGIYERVQGGAREQDRPALARGAVLQPEAAAEDLETGHEPHAEDGQGNRHLEQREAVPGCPSPHDASPTWMRPISGSSRTRSRFW